MVPLIAMALQNRTTFIDNLSYNNSVTCFQFEKTMVRKVKLRGVLLCRYHWPRIAKSSKFKLDHIQRSIPHQEKSNFKVPVRSGKLLSVTSDDMCSNF